MFVVVMRLRVFVDDDASAKAAVGSAAESRLLRQMRPSPKIIVLERDLGIAGRERMKMAAIVVAILLDQIAAVAANGLQASRVGFVNDRFDLTPFGSFRFDPPRVKCGR